MGETNNNNNMDDTQKVPESEAAMPQAPAPEMTEEERMKKEAEAKAAMPAENPEAAPEAQA